MIRHANKDRGWAFAGRRPKRESMPTRSEMRDAFRDFARRHKVPRGKWGRLEVEE